MWKLIGTDRQTMAQLVTLAAPMVISQGTFAVMVFTDRYFLSLIGPTHVAAALGGGVAAMCCLSLFLGWLSYGNALVARFFGARQWSQCPKVLTQALLIAMFSWPLVLLAGWGVYHLFDTMGHDAQQVALEREYFRVLIVGSILTLLKVSFASYFSGLGRTRYVMVADLTAVFINVPLTYALVFGAWGFPLVGIAGAALGTVFANAIALLLFASFYWARAHYQEFEVARAWRVDRNILSRLVGEGFPSGLEMFLNIAAFNVFVLLFQSYGVAEGASAAIVLNWDLLSFVPMVGVHIALISLVGRFVGAGDVHRLTAVIRAGFFLGIAYSGTLGTLFVVFREELVGVFLTSGIDAPEIRDLAAWMMLGMASYVMADAVILVSSGVLRGAGDTRWLMCSSALLHWAMVLVQYLVIVVWQLGPEFAWIVFVSMILTLAVVFVLRLQGSRWRQAVSVQGLWAK
ncbi:MATE family efflux transporter [Pseudomaricurvus alkylphenolicus]|uniref:MATE family efflux transporter n=1 Tax=Pseudomaricurvus alkylphenolicus TaxID=1306991 RepID=UPI001F0D03EF|nr:MATE family efflux transporter [Pseudomaricurvus alkylphenolicus]